MGVGWGGWEWGGSGVGGMGVGWGTRFSLGLFCQMGEKNPLRDETWKNRATREHVRGWTRVCARACVRACARACVRGESGAKKWACETCGWGGEIGGKGWGGVTGVCFAWYASNEP